MSKETKIVCADGWCTRIVERYDTSFVTYWLVTVYAPSGEVTLDRITYIKQSPNDLMELERLARMRYVETEFRRGNKLVQ